MKSTLLIILSLTATLSFVSCGKKSSAEDQYVSLLSGNIACSGNQVEAYNSVVNACNISNSDDRSGVEACISTTDLFIQHNPNLNCAAAKRLTMEEFTINETAVRSLQGEFTREAYFNFENGRACGKYFIKDYASLFESSCSGGEFRSKEAIKACIEAMNSFKSAHPSFNCSVTNNGETSVFKASDLTDLISELQSNL